MKEKKIIKKDFGREFEEEVKAFLEEKLQFLDVKGSSNFHIASSGKKNQIDACGRYGNILFVFECKASGRKTKRSLRQDIFATKERARIVLENYKNIPEYANCKFVKFIFITKKIEISDAEKDLFEDTNFCYADENLLEYYSDLYDKIGEYAIYNFLADYGIRPPGYEQLQFTAIKTKIGKHKVYSFYARPKELLKFSYVARRRSLNENFYQRMLDKSRIKKIQQFLSNGGVFPTNVVISLKNKDKDFKKIDCKETSKDLEIGILTIRNSYNACWIIDGQHRLYSFAKSKSNDLIPCIAFDEINIEDERSFFLEINREQKPIQSDLIWDLEGLSNPNTSRGIISNIVRTLDNREPFLGKIYIPARGSKSGKSVNMAAFCNGIFNASLTKRITPNCVGIENPLFVDITRTITNRIAGVLERYFMSLEEKIKREYASFVFGNAGIPIMLYLLEPIIAHIGRIPSYVHLEKYIDAIVEFFEDNYPKEEDLKKLKSEVNSEGARRNIAKQIGLYIRREIKDKRFWPKMEHNEFVKEIIDMERRIANLIYVQLSQITTSWEKQRVPQVIYKIAKRRMKRDGTRFDENLSLGDELQIITKGDNWDDVFEGIFINKNGFLDKKELETSFSYLFKIRNPASHGKSVISSKEDLDLCGIYLQKLSRVVPEVIPEYSNSDLVV